MIEAAYTPDLILFKELQRAAEPESRIVDVGCGQGRFVKLCLDNGIKNMSGCDLFMEAETEQEKQRLAAELAKTFPFTLMTDERLPYPDNSFDIVVSNQVLEHVPDKRFLVGEMVRILRPGGRLLLVFPTADSIFEAHVYLPWFHRFNLKNRLVRALYYVLVTLRLGAQGRKSTRYVWLTETFDYFPKFIFHKNRREYGRIFKEKGLDFEYRDDDYFAALAARKPRLASLSRLKWLRRMLVKQIGAYVVAEKRAPLNRPQTQS